MENISDIGGITLCHNEFLGTHVPLIDNSLYKTVLYATVNGIYNIQVMLGNAYSIKTVPKFEYDKIRILNSQYPINIFLHWLYKYYII